MTYYKIDQELEAYQSLVRALPQSMFLLDKERVIIGVFNATPESLAGTPLDDIVGKSILFFANNPESPFYQACSIMNSTFDTVFSTGIPLKIEYVIIDSFFEATITKIAGDRILSQVRDITSIVKKLRDTEERKHSELAIALMAGGLTTWRYNVEKGIFSSNQSTVFVQSEMSIDDLYNIVSPDYRQITLKMFDEIINQGAKHVNITVQVMSLDGNEKWTEVHAVPHEYNENGDVTTIIGSQKDITNEHNDQALLEELLDKNELILNNTSSGFVYLNSELKVEWENISSIFTDKEITTLFHVGDKCGSMCNESAFQCNAILHNVINSRSKSCNKITTSNGLVVEIIAQSVFDNNNTLRGIVVRIDDITEREHMLLELALSKEQAVQSDKLKSAFLANMSHEIRTPLNSIVGFAQLIPDADSPEEQQDYINVVNLNSEMLLNLINDILDLSKIEAGYFTRNDEIFNLTELFTELELIFHHKMNSGIELICTTPVEDYPVNLDRIRISQLITNFLTNSVKFTQEGHIKMGFEIVPRGVRLFVEDTGCGMNPEQAARVFERFEKLNSFAQGTGLGTAIAKAVVDAYGGKIGVESAEGVGTKFWAILPANINNEQPNDITIMENNTTPVITDRLSTIQILIAEDNDSNFLLLKALLKGYNIKRACNGLEAVEMAQKDHFDLILMDIRMPEMDGIEATQLIRKADSGIPIVAVTANAFDEDRKRAFDAGVNDFLTKPVNKTLLLETIKRF